MKIFHIIALFTVGGFMTASTLCASTRTCRIVYPERPKDAPKIAYLFDGELNHRVSFPSMNFSSVIEIADDAKAVALSLDPIADPENLPEGLPIIKIPEGVTSFYILMTPDDKNKTLPIKPHLVDCSFNKLKAGETLWFNLSQHKVIGKLGKANMEVNPQSKTITKDPAPNSGYYVAKLAYQPNGKGEYARITEQSWWHDTKSRHLGFIVDKGGRLPKIYFYRDFRLPKALRNDAVPAP